MGIFWVGVFRVGVFLGGSFPGGNFLGGSFPGGNCPVGIIQVAIFRVGVFMLPKVLYSLHLCAKNLSVSFLGKKNKPVCSGHLVLADKFSRNRRCPL